MITFPYNDGVLKAWETRPGWIMIEWLYPGRFAVRTYRTFWKLDSAVRKSGFRGWLMSSERAHANMHRHIMRVGGCPYAIDAMNVYFKKCNNDFVKSEEN